MTARSAVLPHERRKGESALSDFADYVERQQAVRYPLNAGAAGALAATTASPSIASTAPTSVTSAANRDDTLDELDDILDALDLDDAVPLIPMRQLLTAPGDETSAGDADANFVALSTLLAERIDEGNGEAVLDLGFEHTGDTLGLTRDQWAVALARVERAADRAGADCELLLTRNVGGPLDVVQEGGNGAGASAGAGTGVGSATDCTGKLMIRRRPRKVEDVIETRIAVVGNVDAGKSSLLGVLVKGDLDDGRGRARVNLFRHKHEFETGRTSSVGMEILGFDTRGRVVASDTPGRKLSWEEIGKRSAKVITFTDLAGHERYLRTTMFGMMSTAPNYCLLMVAANNGLIGMSKEHLGIALALNVPIMVIITKIDICPPNILAETITQITRVLKSPGARKIPIFIKNRDDCVNTATQFVSQRICPVFQISNVTGQNLDLVRTFLNILPHHGRYDAGGAFEFHVNDTYSVPFVGTVVSGIVKSGVAHAGDAIWIGPDANGHFAPTSIRSIERKRLGVPAASAGQSASFSLKKMRRKDVRKGQVVLHRTDDSTPPRVYREFVAEVLILSHATTIKHKYQATVHVGPVHQTCAIVDMDRPLLRTGERALVAFRFLQRPEFLVPGDRLLFREGRTKGLGIIKSVGYDPSHPLMSTPAAGGDEAEAETETGAAAPTTTK
ncbi:GTP-binding protein 1 [Sporothrix schenckii 1099-18]|uniref:GTP-binding protein 1 n=1 Tax=Sporothrix schenckii 1099-18 TaxID=1397361 RepID=A0A0F2MMC9_SPOSC|nr:GTP-binding protein 1 [Sporothrix schenckii 1099-18]KJR89341.1 GTP-binding protein 1 [Sporothrix schenckii 1099-18]